MLSRFLRTSVVVVNASDGRSLSDVEIETLALEHNYIPWSTTELEKRRMQCMQ